ncbi:MAG: hypothetical protein Q8P11_04310 [bacterium]|nr:hypothetical protein [bacterium]
MKKQRWIIRAVCIFILLAWMIWIIDANVALWGYKKVEYFFGDPGPVVSELQPVARLGPKETLEGKRSYQKMFEDPTYFDLITPVTYRRAKLKLYFRNDTNIPLRIGIRWDSKSNYKLYDLIKDGEEDGWTVAKAEIDMTSARYENGKYRFVLSAPGLVRGNPDRYIALSSIVIELYKDPIYK